MAYGSLIDYFERLGTLIDCGKPTDYRGQEIHGKLLIRSESARSNFDGSVMYNCRGSSVPTRAIPINFKYVDLISPNLLTNQTFLGPRSFAPPKDLPNYSLKDLNASSSFFFMFYFGVGLESVSAKGCVFEGCEFSSVYIRYSGASNTQVYSHLNLQESHFYASSFESLKIQDCDFTGCHFGLMRDLHLENEEYLEKKATLIQRKTFERNSKSRFIGCELYKTIFDNSVIENVNFFKNLLQDVNFENSKIAHSTFDRCSILGDVSFAGASLYELVFRDYNATKELGFLSFENARLQSVAFENWPLANTSLKNATLTQCLSSGYYYHGYLHIEQSTSTENTKFKDMRLFSEENSLKDCVLESCTYLRARSGDIEGYTPPISFENVVCLQTIFKDDLKTHSLRDSVFKRCEFRDMSFSGDLGDAVFEDVVFERVRFHQADLEGTQFIRCTFDDTHFEHLNLTRTTFKNSSFIGEDKPFTKAYYQIGDASLTEDFFEQNGASSLSSIDGRGLDLRFFRFYDLTGYVDLSGTDFSRANLEGVDFSQCLLADVDFTNANLKGADFGDGDSIGGADFRGSNFDLAYGLEERVCESCFKGAAYDESLQLALERPPGSGYGFRNQVKEIHICEDCAHTCEVCLDTFPINTLAWDRDGDPIHSECYGVCEYCKDLVPKGELEDYSHLESCEAYEEED